MINSCFHLAYLGPGGPEFMIVMLVLLVMFGAKDAPRILRKLNEIFNQVRNTADSFKREVMYGDLNSSTPSYTSPDTDDDDYDEYEEDDYYDHEESDDWMNDLDDQTSMTDDADSENTDIEPNEEAEKSVDNEPEADSPDEPPAQEKERNA